MVGICLYRCDMEFHMDWDTCSVVERKNPQKNSFMCGVAETRKKYPAQAKSKDFTTPVIMESNPPIREAWRFVFPIETYPQIQTTKSITAEMEEVKRQNESVLRVVSTLQIKVDFLERQIKNQNQTTDTIYNFEEIRKISEENMKEIKKALHLSDRDKKISLRERIHKLDGFLKEYSDNKTNSVDLVKDIRDDW